MAGEATIDLLHVVQLLGQLGANVSLIKDEMLPSLARDAREARDGVRALDLRVGALEMQTPIPAPAVNHSDCVQEERLQDHEVRLRTHTAWRTRSDVALTALVRLRGWLTGGALVIAGSFLGFAATTIATSTEHATKIQSLETVMARHDQELRSITTPFDRGTTQLLRERPQPSDKVPETKSAPAGEKLP